jgi:hypothetical protein
VHEINLRLKFNWDFNLIEISATQSWYLTYTNTVHLHVCVCVCVPIGNNSEIKLMSKANIYAYPSGAPEFNADF